MTKFARFAKILAVDIDSSDLLTAPQAAELLGVTAETVRQWAKAEVISHVTLPSGGYRFRRSVIAAILEPAP